MEEDPVGFQAGDADLYRYVENGPVNGIDPFGWQKKPAPSEMIKGNQYGNWKITQENEWDLTGPFESRVRIEFIPNKATVKSSKIVFVQIVRIIGVITGEPVENEKLV